MCPFAVNVIDVLSDMSILRGIPTQIRSGNCPEFITKELREWIVAAGGEDGLHPAGLSMEERLFRELQPEVARLA